ncbi:MAG TPA: HDOD domain-containing protein [Desulfobacterales bacterium]|nr:HDOD domain-containing protein [Desulfobacterales bacterium]
MSDNRRQQFKAALRETKNLPTLPGIVTKLTKMADDPDTTTEQMGKVISKDHILAAKLLKLVNSAFYGFPQRISSLSSAIILLGFNVVKSLIISASIFEVMEDQDVELWEHSLGCAVAAGVVARRLEISEPEEISTAGLIHDLGKVAVKMEFSKEYQAVNRLMAERGIAMREAEMEIMGINHAEVGGWLAKNWNLPIRLVEPISCHHTPEQAVNEPVSSAVVHFADILIRGMGYGHAGDNKVPMLNKKAWDLLNFGPADLDEIIDEVEEKLWDVKGFSLEITADAAQDDSEKLEA